MDVKLKLQSRNSRPKRAGGGVDTRQRRALARLGLASASAYAAPTLLALRSAPRNLAAPGRVVIAA
jgi:hypothetical protein